MLFGENYQIHFKFIHSSNTRIILISFSGNSRAIFTGSLRRLISIFYGQFRGNFSVALKQFYIKYQIIKYGFFWLDSLKFSSILVGHLPMHFADSFGILLAHFRILKHGWESPEGSLTEGDIKTSSSAIAKDSFGNAQCYFWFIRMQAILNDDSRDINECSFEVKASAKLEPLKAETS